MDIKYKVEDCSRNNIDQVDMLLWGKSITHNNNYNN